MARGVLLARGGYRLLGLGGVTALLSAYARGWAHARVNGSLVKLTAGELRLLLYASGMGVGTGAVGDVVEVGGFRFIRRVGDVPTVDPSIAEVYAGAYEAVGFTYKDSVVLDVGAYVGDSAFYFVRQGARLVYAVEPIDEYFKALELNIKLNGLEGVVKPIHARIGEAKQWPPSLAGRLTCTAPYTTLTYLKSITGAGILKLDCEGCEWWILKNEAYAFTGFDVILVEVHGKASAFARQVEGLGFRLASIRRTPLSSEPILTFVRVK